MSLLTASLLAWSPIFWPFGILLTIFWIWMLVDCLTSTSLQGNEKLIWVLVLIFLPFLGAILYFFLARGQKL